MGEPVADILRLAAALTAGETDRLAHALGWPKLYAIQSGRFGRPKWLHPFRRYYCAPGGADHPEWAAVHAAGLATPRDNMGPGTTWTVTPLGQAVVRVRLQAEIERMRHV